MQNYLDISQADDLQDKKERFAYRLFEILPAFISFGTIILAFALSWLAPVAVAVFIIAFDFFWLLRIAYLSFHQITSHRQMKRNMAADWLELLDKLPVKQYSLQVKSWKDIFHVVLLPLYKEGADIVRPTFLSLLSCRYPKDKMIVVLAVEEKGGEGAKEVVKEMEKEFGDKFFRFFVAVHPQNVQGEIAGKGSNVSFAVKKMKEMLSGLNIPSENIIVSNFDIDTRPYPEYFGILTYKFLTSQNPLRASYQPVPIYNNNVWQAPAFSRVVATSGTFWQMMQQERQEQLVSYSAHSLPLKVVEEVGYSSNVVSDDSRIFWKAYLRYNGDYRVLPLHYPVSMDAVMSGSLKKTMINQYRQQRRWAWGCENIPYMIFGFMKNKKIKLYEKIRHTLVTLDGFWSWAVAALLIFFLGWLPLIFGGEEFKVSLLSYNLPRFTSRIMTAANIGILISAISSLLLLPPLPKGWNSRKKLSIVFQWLLLPFTLIFLGVVPALESQMRLAIGKRLGFWATEKTSVDKNQ